MCKERILQKYKTKDTISTAVENYTYLELNNNNNIQQNNNVNDVVLLLENTRH